jgi:hypothetical protein
MSEQWRTISGWPAYQVSNLGRVKHFSGKNMQKERILKPSSRGDAKIVLHDGINRRSEKVSRLVLLAFVGEPPARTESCHWDDNKQNNVLSNLRWDTHKANAQDALRNGLMHIGERSHKAKLTEYDVRKIRYERSQGRKVKWLAERYKVSKATIRAAATRKLWKHVI